jgi:hypothetical protein
MSRFLHRIKRPVRCSAGRHESRLAERALPLVNTVSATREEMEFLSEFWLYVRTRKKFWLLPIVVALGLFGGLIVLTKGTAVAPFIYTLF